LLTENLVQAQEKANVCTDVKENTAVFWAGDGKLRDSNLSIGKNGKITLSDKDSDVWPGLTIDTHKENQSSDLILKDSSNEKDIGYYFLVGGDSGNGRGKKQTDSMHIFNFYDHDGKDDTTVQHNHIMSMSKEGYVGIGTTNPKATLDVAGPIKSQAVYANEIRGAVVTSNRSPVGMESNLLFNATNRYKVTQTAFVPEIDSSTRKTSYVEKPAGKNVAFDLERLFDGRMFPSYTPKGIIPEYAVTILIEDLPKHHIQAGAWVGWTTRYWPVKKFKIEGYNEYKKSGHKEGKVGWKVLADYSDNNYKGGGDFLVRLPYGAYTKLKFTFYEGSGRKDSGGAPRAGLSELFFLHPESSRMYSGLLPSSMWEVKGRVGIGTKNPTKALHVNGEALAKRWNTSSDLRLKTDLKEMDNALEKIKKLTAYYYKFKDKMDKEEVGLIAQEVQKVLPEVVSQDADGYLSLDYGRLTPLLINGIKELEIKSEELKVKNEKLEERVSQLEGQIEKIYEKLED
jgi:hypothetical protein